MYVDNLIKKQHDNIIWAGLINLKLKNIQNRNENISNNCTPAESPVLAPPSRPHCVSTCPVQTVHVSATRSQQRPSHVDMRWDTWSVLVLAGGWRGCFCPSLDIIFSDELSRSISVSLNCSFANNIQRYCTNVHNISNELV